MFFYLRKLLLRSFRQCGGNFVTSEKYRDVAPFKSGLLNYVRYIRDFIFVISGVCSIHSSVTLATLKNIVRYSGTSLYRGCTSVAYENQAKSEFGVNKV